MEWNFSSNHSLMISLIIIIVQGLDSFPIISIFTCDKQLLDILLQLCDIQWEIFDWTIWSMKRSIWEWIFCFSQSFLISIIVGFDWRNLSKRNETIGEWNNGLFNWDFIRCFFHVISSIFFFVKKQKCWIESWSDFLIFIVINHLTNHSKDFNSIDENNSMKFLSDLFNQHTTIDSMIITRNSIKSHQNYSIESLLRTSLIHVTYLHLIVDIISLEQ